VRDLNLNQVDRMRQCAADDPDSSRWRDIVQTHVDVRACTQTIHLWQRNASFVN